MNMIAVRDVDTGAMIPIGDPAQWTCQQLLFQSAVMSNGYTLHKILISDLIAAHIWKSEWSVLPDIPMPDSHDELGIVCNEDQTR